MPLLQTLVEARTLAVTALPGSPSWLCATDQEGRVTTGRLGQPKARAMAYGGRSAFAASIIALHGVDATTVALTDGLAVGRYEVGETGRLTRRARWALPGELGWRAHLASSGDRVAVASDRRLGVLGDEPRVITEEGNSDQHFWSPAFLPDGETLAVGRGDGRVELRDARSLEVRRTFHVFRGAILALCVLDGDTLAVADDYATTGLLRLGTGAFEELDLQRMKTSGLHRLPDGLLLAVGLSRRISIFEGTRRVRGVDLSAELGDRYIQDSAVAGGSLLLACEQRGLLALELDQVPAEAAPAPLDLPLPPDVIRARATAVAELAVLQQALASGQDASARVARLLEVDDEELRRNVFGMLAMQNVPLPEAGRHLASPNARVRYYAADAFGYRPALYAGRSAELLPLLADPDPTVVAAATWALGEMGDAAHAPALEALLRHPAEWVQNTAGRALMALKTGTEAIADAIRAGAYEHTISAWLAVWPSPPAPPIDPAVRALLSEPRPVEELLRALGASARPEFLAEHAGELVQAQGLAPPKASAGYVLVATTRARRWPLIVDDGRPMVATPSVAADFWAQIFRERWPPA